MENDQHNINEKRVDLKRHQRHKKKTPWRLLIKAVVILILFYLVKLGIDTIIHKQAKEKQQVQPNTEVEIEVEE